MCAGRLYSLCAGVLYCFCPGILFEAETKFESETQAGSGAGLTHSFYLYEGECSQQERYDDWKKEERL